MRFFKSKHFGSRHFASGTFAGAGEAVVEMARRRFGLSLIYDGVDKTDWAKIEKERRAALEKVIHKIIAPEDFISIVPEITSDNLSALFAVKKNNHHYNLELLLLSQFV